MLFAPSGKGRKRQKKGEKGRFRPISGKGSQTPLKPPFVTPPFAAAQKEAPLNKGPLGFPHMCPFGVLWYLLARAWIDDRQITHLISVRLKYRGPPKGVGHGAGR